MRIFLDTTDPAEAAELWAWGCFAGVTTNPILVARAGQPVEQVVEALGAAMPGEVFAQARGATADALTADGERLAALLPGRMVIKIPAIPAGLEAMRRLKERDVLTAATAIFRAGQALLAARAGASHVIPFWCRLREAGGDPAHEVTQAVTFVERLASAGVRARVLTASLRTAADAEAALSAGSHAITVAPDVARALLADEGTRAAVAAFDAVSGDE